MREGKSVVRGLAAVKLVELVALEKGDVGGAGNTGGKLSFCAYIGVKACLRVSSVVGEKVAWHPKPGSVYAVPLYTPKSVAVLANEVEIGYRSSDGYSCRTALRLKNGA